MPIVCFVTFCVLQKQCLLGKIEDSTVVLSKYGKRIEEIWLDIGRNNPNVDISTYVVMPNHFHAIIDISPNGTTEEPDTAANGDLGILLETIRKFKSFTTHEINAMRDTMRFHIWQRGYYDHIIRDQNEYDIIKRYIQTNVVRWRQDRFYMPDQS